MATELVIKINGDLKNYEDALEQAQERTEALEGRLTTLAKVSGVAFAALTAEILLSAKAFGESQAASNKLTQALQNQGLYSKELIDVYKGYASAIQEKTGLDDDSVVSAIASVQALIGQTKVTEELTQSIVDLSAAQGMDLEATAELIGKGINGQVASLQKLGIVIEDHLTKEQRTAKIIQEVTQRFGGQAAAANQGLSSIRGLESAFGDLQEEIGRRFAPVLELLIKNVTKFFTTLSGNQDLLNLITSVLVAGTVVSGLGLAVGTAGTAFLAFKAALTAAGIATNAMTIATRALVGATGLGLIAILVSEIYLNWETVWPRMQAVYQSFVENVTGLSNGLGTILGGVFTFNTAKIKSGLDQVKAVIQNGYRAATADLKPITIATDKQDPSKLAAAAANAAREVEIETIKQQRLEAERQLALLKIQDANAQEIALKTEQIETLKTMEDEKNASLRASLDEHLTSLRSAEQASHDIGLQQNEDFYKGILATTTEYNDLSAAEKELFATQYNDKLRQSLETEKSIRLTYANQQVQEDIQRRNKFLEEEQKFGTAYAAIHSAMNSNVFQGTKSAFGELAALQQSENAELKAIGKAAALANIAIKTAEGAMNIYAGFSAIPVVGPVLGAAGAAAFVAFGVEQASKVLAANQGGIVTGGIPGVDSVSAMLTPGELVVPQKNFDETVNAVANQRAGVSGVGEGGSAVIEISLKDELMDFIEAKLVERSRLNISIQGVS